MRHGRKLLVCAGILAVAGALVYVARPAGHIALYDANLVRLAETDLQAYCAGEAFWQSGGAGDRALAAACRSRLAGQRPDIPDVGAVPGAFCRALVTEGWEDGTVVDCVGILLDVRLWPTYDGGLSDQWNRARPYPGRPISTGPAEDESRTGGRQGGNRPTEDPRTHIPYAEEP